jgi:hypothetical protein
MKYIIELLLCLVMTNLAYPSQVTFRVVTNKRTYEYNERIVITIIAKNDGDIPETLRFTTSCQAGYYIDTLNYMHPDSNQITCMFGFTDRIIPARDSVRWGGTDWMYYFTGERLGSGRHGVVAWLACAPAGWISDTLWISVNSPTDVSGPAPIPEQNELIDNYPNPFNPATSLRYSLSRPEYVTLTVYDVLGRAVAILVDHREESGNYAVGWDGSAYPSGIYIYRLTVGSYTKTSKMVLIK